jgi:stringent starvation protein B
VPGAPAEETRPSPLTSVPAATDAENKVVQLVTPEGSAGTPPEEPPRPPSGPRPALKRVK